MNRPIAPLSVIGLIMLGCINAWLLSIVTTEITGNRRASVDKVIWNPNLSVSAEHVAPSKPIGAYTETLAHPIFFKSRAPFVAPPPPPPPPPPKVSVPPAIIVDPGLVVGGIIIEGDLKKAYLFTKTNPMGTWANEGDNFVGWKVKLVNPTGAILEQQGRAIELQLYPKR